MAGLKRTDGHAAGEEALFDAVEGGARIGLKWLTVFAFSTENWRRPLDEVRFLMAFNERLLLNRRDDLQRQGCAGPLHRPAHGSGAARVRRIEETEALTRNRQAHAHVRVQLRRAGRARRRSRRSLARSAAETARSGSGRRACCTVISAARYADPGFPRAHLRASSTGSQLPPLGSRVFGAALHLTCCGPTSARQPLRSNQEYQSFDRFASARSQPVNP